MTDHSVFTKTIVLTVIFMVKGQNVVIDERTNAALSKPQADQWVLGVEPENKLGLLDWLMSGCAPGVSDCKPRGDEDTEYGGYDGWYNNRAHPDLGAIDTPLLRRLPNAYSDGTYQPSGSKRPNPLVLSERIMNGTIGTTSVTGKSALLVFFGQQIVEEVLDAQRPGCPPEYFNIKIPSGHPLEGLVPEHPFLRSRYSTQTGTSPNNPRQQLNEITPWLDGGLVYGTSKAWTDVLRTFKNGSLAPHGQLAYSHEGLFPEYNNVRLPLANPPPPTNHFLKPVNRFFMLGNPRGNENPFILTMGVLWFRWHNHIAKYLASKHPDWTDEKVFNEARKWVVAVHQKVVIYEWLPNWLGSHLDLYKGYQPHIDPQVSEIFQTAAMRFGHTLVTPGVYRRHFSRDGCDLVPPLQIMPQERHKAGVRTCNFFWNPQDPILESLDDASGTNQFVDIDRILMGLASQISEREDNVIVPDLRGGVFGPLELSRRDLMAINIQRGRDHGLPDYNTARKEFGLSPIKSFDEFLRITESRVGEFDPQVLKRFAEVYNNSVDDIDVWVGGLLETTRFPGQLFQAVLRDQFSRIRDGDRFWFENKLNGLFTPEEVERIQQLTLYDIIISVTKMQHDDIPQNVFMVPSPSINPGLNPVCMDKLQRGHCKIQKYTAVGDPIPEEEFDCYHFPPLGSIEMPLEKCTKPETFDYFSGSEVSYVLTFILLGAAVIVIIHTMFFMARKKKMKEYLEANLSLKRISRMDEFKGPVITANEWVGTRETRSVLLRMLTDKRKLEVRTTRGLLLRSIDLSRENIITIQDCTDGEHYVIKVPREYDLVLHFQSPFLREQFIQHFKEYLNNIGVSQRVSSVHLKHAYKMAVTVEHRKERLEKFFRAVFSKAFQITSQSSQKLPDSDVSEIRDAFNTELTKTEFADCLSVSPDSTFVEKMFHLVDKDCNGYISFREFLDMLIIFAKGSAEDKVKLMFDMYDIDHSGKLTRDDFTNMISSMVELASSTIDQDTLKTAVSNMFRSAGLGKKHEITFEEFKRFFGDYRDELGFQDLQVQPDRESQMMESKESNKRATFYNKARQTLVSIYSEPNQPADVKSDDLFRLGVQTSYKKSGFGHHYFNNLQLYSRQIFWAVLYSFVVIGIFVERAYVYSVEAEHGGLRRVAGYGVTVTRGAASAMMFTYSTLLVTLCRNLITKLRETFLHAYIPFDSSLSMHKFIAYLALLFTVVHIVGHSINFYHISTQTADDLTCLFRDYFHASHELPKFHYWCWGTITGITGVILLLIAAIMYTFSTQFARKHLFDVFWKTHHLYPLFYIFTVLHGAGRLVQDPFFHYFFLGPVILFTLDRLASLTRKKVEISVIKAELLPSGVTKLEFKKPDGFEYKSGQWVRIACPVLNSNEYHPFTLSSSPQEENLTVHVRAVGPWTRNLRIIYDPDHLRDHPLPKIHLDGPFGEGHQEWFRYDVAVLIGAGIGITPFASILKDIVFRLSSGSKIQSKKIYFLWVTRTQKHFEWMIDIIREVEKKDTNGVVSVHIFITQFYQKYDLRTIMLYVTERHFYRISNKSLFTGLRAVTHFGRPQFYSLLKNIRNIHPETQSFGVFSCGPRPMTQNVDGACKALNLEADTLFKHHSENF